MIGPGGSAPVVTGIGAVTPLGVGLAALRGGLGDPSGPAVSPFVVETIAPLAFPVIHAPLPEFDFGQALEATPATLRGRALRAARRAPVGLQALVLAALEAWRKAGLDGPAPVPERAAVIVAAQNGTTGQQYRLSRTFAQAPHRLSPAWATGFMDSHGLAVLSELFGLNGEGACVGGASASGTVALIQGARLIASGVADLCLVAAAPADLSPMELQALSSLGALGGAACLDDPGRACRPFDAAADGFIPGQSAAAIVLEAPQRARARGAVSLARLAGGATALSGTAHTEPNGGAEVRAMTAALAHAGLSPTEVDHVAAHATSTPLGDAVEAEAILTVFDQAAPPVTALKGVIGHGLASAGVVEAAAAVLQMRAARLHPVPNLDTPVSDRLDVVRGAPRHVAIRSTLCNGFGFGGIHAALVLTSADADVSPFPRRQVSA